MTPEEKKAFDEQLAGLKKDLQEVLTKEAKAQIEAAIKELETKNKPVDLTEINKFIADTKAAQVTKDEADKKNQKAIDDLVAAGQQRKTEKPTRSFGEAFAAAVEEKQDDIKAFDIKNRNSKLILDIKDFSMSQKAVGTMTTGANLTGDPQFTYNLRQGLIPADKINLRDLIPTAHSATGQYITYTEQAGEGAPTMQVEGASKAQIDSDFTNVKIVNTYLSAFQRFSKQFMYNLPWLQTTLSRILLRRFYQKENSLFYANLAVNSTPATTAATNTAERMIDMIAQQGTANFASSFFLLPWAGWAALLKTGYPATATSYSIPGGVTFDANGIARIGGVMSIPASWVTPSDDIQLVDSDYIERVETESLRVDFSFEDADNFTKNLITARIECLEELNLLRTDAHLNYGTAS